MTKALQLLADREDQQAAQDDTAELFARVADLEQRCPYPVRACSPTSSEPVAVLAFDPEVNIGDTLPPPTWVEHAPPRHT